MTTPEQRQQIRDLLLEAAHIVAQSLEENDTGDAIVTRAMLVFEYMDAGGDKTIGYHRGDDFSMADLSLISGVLGNAGLVSWIEDSVERILRRLLDER